MITDALTESYARFGNGIIRKVIRVQVNTLNFHQRLSVAKSWQLVFISAQIRDYRDNTWQWEQNCLLSGPPEGTTTINTCLSKVYAVLISHNSGPISFARILDTLWHSRKDLPTFLHNLDRAKGRGCFLRYVGTLYRSAVANLPKMLVVNGSDSTVRRDCFHALVKEMLSCRITFITCTRRVGLRWSRNPT